MPVSRDKKIDVSPAVVSKVNHPPETFSAAPANVKDNTRGWPFGECVPLANIAGSCGLLHAPHPIKRVATKKDSEKI